MLFILLIGLVIWLSIAVYNFLDGRKLLRDLYDEFRLSRLSLAQCDDICSKNTNKSSIVVCLTTIPSRLPYIEPTLKSLLTQKYRPQKICLHIPVFSNREQTQYNVQSSLSLLKNVEIVSCNDFGPATKLIPALSKYKNNQDLLIVDDDMLYPPGLIAHFDMARKSNPDRAIGSSGWLVPDDFICHYISLKMNIFNIPPMPYKSSRIGQPKEIDVLQGYSGYLVKPSFFDLDKLLDYSNAPKGAYYVDDVWVSAHCKVSKFIFPYHRFCFHSTKFKKFHKTSSLAVFNKGDNNAELRNNTIVIQHFKERWLNSSAGKSNHDI
ncbi:MAG: glycosyltransferase family A protein [Cyclobacteriaceae bacterium]